MSTVSNSINRMLKESERSRREDAKAYANLDQDLCQICGAYGNDKRSLYMGCFYDLKEVAPEFLSLWYASRSERTRSLFYLRICKSCRAEILEAVGKAIEARRALRSQRLDHDGYLEEDAEVT